MHQEWNKHVRLPDEILTQCEQIKPVDILIGVLCKDVELTVLNVLNVVNEGLYTYFPDSRKCIVISEGKSSDKTSDVLNLFEPYTSIKKIVTEDMTDGGKGAGIMTILEIAHQTEAKCIGLLDGDLLSVKPVWIQQIINPIFYGRADLTVPYYIRDKNDAVITNNLVYPFTRALYGMDIRQPIAGEFGLSQLLYEMLRSHPLFPPDFGVDIFIVTVAAANEMKIREALYSLKIHESTTRYLEPEKLLVPMFRKVSKSMFDLALHYEHQWKNTTRIRKKIRYRHSFSKKPIPVKVDIEKLKHSYIHEFKTKKDVMKNYLPAEHMKKLIDVVENHGMLTADIWAEVVYHHLASYKRANNVHEKSLLLETLKTLWIIRFVSYVNETQHMDVNEAEDVIQKQAEIFEQKIEYLRSII